MEQKTVFFLLSTVADEGKTKESKWIAVAFFFPLELRLLLMLSFFPLHIKKVFSDLFVAFTAPTVLCRELILRDMLQEFLLRISGQDLDSTLDILVQEDRHELVQHRHDPWTVDHETFPHPERIMDTVQGCTGSEIADHVPVTQTQTLQIQDARELIHATSQFHGLDLGFPDDLLHPLHVAECEFIHRHTVLRQSADAREDEEIIGENDGM